MADVLLPRLSDSMEEGTILRWLKADGDAVQPGDELAEIETDKATDAFQAEAGGVLRHVAREGDTVRVGTLIATIAVDNAASLTPPAVAPAATSGKKGEVVAEELTRGQQLVARRTAEAKATMPELSVRAEADMEACAALLGELGPEVGFDDLVVRATALALRDVPKANGAYRDARFERFSRVNVGVAVAGERILAVPTIFDADLKGAAEIARETRALADRVRAGVATQPELSGGTFTVSSVGASGAASFHPIIHAAQAAILGVGAVRVLPRVVDGRIAPRHVVELTLVADHRILYGPEAAHLLDRIRARLEDPREL